MINIILAIDRVAFEIGNIQIYWYAIIIVFGMLMGLLLAYYYTKKFSFPEDLILELFIFSVVFAIIGARTVYVLANDGFFPIESREDFFNLFNIREGGLTIIGGIAFGALGVFVASRHNKVSFLKTADISVPCLLVGQIIGRWGNFINQEAYGGVVTNEAFQKFPFAVFIERNNAWHYATFLYEGLMNLVVLIAIIFMLRSKKIKTGVVMFFYLMCYGVIRAIMETTRMDAVIKDWGFLGMVNITQLLCVVVAIATLIVIVLIQIGKIKTCENVMLPCKNTNQNKNEKNNENINESKINSQSINSEDTNLNITESAINSQNNNSENNINKNEINIENNQTINTNKNKKML